MVSGKFGRARFKYSFVARGGAEGRATQATRNAKPKSAGDATERKDHAPDGSHAHVCNIVELVDDAPPRPAAPRLRYRVAHGRDRGRQRGRGRGRGREPVGQDLVDRAVLPLVLGRCKCDGGEGEGREEGEGGGWRRGASASSETGLPRED